MVQSQFEGKAIKLAVEIKTEQKQMMPYLGELNTNQPLAAFIEDLCAFWKVDKPPHMYALKYTETTQPRYVTEKNRDDIKTGKVLHLVYSAARMVQDILEKLRKPGDDDTKRKALETLVNFSTDVTFASEFISKNGMAHLITCLERLGCNSECLPLVLSSFLELMDHGIHPWDNLQPSFIHQIASYINSQQATDPKTLVPALNLLENAVLNSPTLYAVVEKDITVPKLTQHLTNVKKQDVQQWVLALINALIQKADGAQRRDYWANTINSRQFRSSILNNILICTNEVLGPEISHQLHVLQQLMINIHEDRMNTKMDPSDQKATDNIKELRRIAFEADAECPKEVTPRKPEYKKEYKKLGFKNDINPAQDFMVTPPGMLALDNMYYFALNHSDNYAKLVLENCYRADSHECPFGRASIELTKLLCEILQIGEAPSEQGHSFQPLFFSNDHAFEELFSVCIVLLNKTWKEMKATTEDFSKVMRVVKDQIQRTLKEVPQTLEAFKDTINKKTYADIAELWQKERLSNEEQEMQAAPIQELRKQLEPEILGLIEQHRLNFLVEGTRFKTGRGMRAKDKSRYCRLSPNHKFFHYDDCDEKSVPSLEELSKKVSIVDIRGIVVGRECPHMKDKTSKKNVSALAFSFILDSNGLAEPTSLDFVAPDETVFNYWVDGVNALLRQAMTSETTKKDLDMLLNMEIKLRLLDAEGVTILQEAPPVPPPPPHYNFCYQLP